MSKSTALSVENGLNSALFNFKEQAVAVKAAHHAARRAIKDDPMRSDLAKRTDLEALAAQTRGKLDAIKGQQELYISSLRSKVESELRGSQPADASAVLMRRDAADRARKITDKAEAMAVLQDAIFNGDDSMAHAIGNRARNALWLDVVDAYTAEHSSTADSAAALAHIEGLSKDLAFNVANSATYASPND